MPFWSKRQTRFVIAGFHCRGARARCTQALLALAVGILRATSHAHRGASQRRRAAQQCLPYAHRLWPVELIALYWASFPAKTLAWLSGSSMVPANDAGDSVFRGLRIVSDGAMRGKARISQRNRRHQRCHGLRRFATCSFRPEIPGPPRTPPVRRVRGVDSVR